MISRDKIIRSQLSADKPTRGPIDLPFALLVILILCLGLIMMFSASFASAYYSYDNSTYWIVRQGLFAVVGVAIMIIVSFMDYQYFRVFAIPAMAVAIISLILVLFIGKTVNGAKRWIDLGFTQFQPSEIAKLAVILCFSALISVYNEKMKRFKYGILPFAGMLAVISGLMVLQPHLSGIVLIFGIGCILMFIGGVQLKWFAALFSIAGVAGFIAINTMEHAKARIELWRNPFLDELGKGYQAIQSLYAVGSGGLLGLGLGKSRQKYLYLPEQHNDFVFAIVCEELGFIGAVIVLFLFAVLIIRGYWIAIHARDRFGSLLVAGITTLLALQTFLNVAVVTNLIPVTGVSLPFFSYGGTSLVILMLEMGIVLSVSRQIPAPKSG